MRPDRKHSSHCGCVARHSQYAVRVMTRAVSFITARAIGGNSAPPALMRVVAVTLLRRRSSAAMIARVRASSAGSRCRCPSRCSTTCRSVSATKPRLVRSPARPASAPIANEPAYHSGLSRLVRPPSSSMRVCAPGEMIGLLAGRLHQRLPGRRAARRQRLPLVQGLGGDLTGMIDPHQRRGASAVRPAGRPSRRSPRRGRAGRRE